MARILIIEDETKAAEQLAQCIGEVPGLDVLHVHTVRSYDDAAALLSAPNRHKFTHVFCDLLLLPDGYSLEMSALKGPDGQGRRFTSADWQRFVVDEGGIALIRAIRRGAFRRVAPDVPIVVTSFFDALPGYLRLLRMIGAGESASGRTTLAAHDDRLVVLPKVVANPMYTQGIESENVLYREAKKFIQSFAANDFTACRQVALKVRKALFAARVESTLRVMRERSTRARTIPTELLHRYDLIGVSGTLQLSFDPHASKVLLHLLDYSLNRYPFAGMYEDWRLLRDSVLLNSEVHTELSLELIDASEQPSADRRGVFRLGALALDAGLTPQERSKRVLMRCMLAYLAFASEPMQGVPMQVGETESASRGWLVSADDWVRSAFAGVSEMSEAQREAWGPVVVKDLLAAEGGRVDIARLLNPIRDMLGALKSAVPGEYLVVGDKSRGFYFNGDIELQYRGSAKIVPERSANQRVLFLPQKPEFAMACRESTRKVSAEALRDKMAVHGFSVTQVESVPAMANAVREGDICLVGPLGRRDVDAWVRRCAENDASLKSIRDRDGLVVLMTTFRTLLPEKKRATLLSYNIQLMMPSGPDVEAPSEVKLLDTLLCAHERTKYVSSHVDDDEADAEWHGLVQEYLPQFVDSHRRIAELGGVPDPLSGSASVRVGSGMLITSTRTNKLAISSDRLALVKGFDVATAHVEWVGKNRPSSSTPWHWFVYQYYPEVHAILHTHWKPLTYSDDLAAYHTQLLVPYGTAYLGSEVVRTLERHVDDRFAILHEHGEFAVGRSLPDAAAVLMGMADRVGVAHDR
jgi:ribulose-5-phosphate 4-epimerase/fuculose-1-phosphate aldolase